MQWFLIDNDICKVWYAYHCSSKPYIKGGLICLWLRLRVAMPPPPDLSRWLSFVCRTIKHTYTFLIPTNKCGRQFYTIRGTSTSHHHRLKTRLRGEGLQHFPKFKGTCIFLAAMPCKVANRICQLNRVTEGLHLLICTDVFCLEQEAQQMLRSQRNACRTQTWTGTSNMAKNLTSPSTLHTSYRDKTRVRPRKRLKMVSRRRIGEIGSGNMAETTAIDRAYTTSYSPSIVTMALSRPVSEI